MIKKTLRAIAVGMALLPVLAFAAYNDVSMDNSTILTVNSVDLTLTGPTAVLESIVVNGSDFVLTMPGNSYIKVSSTNRRNLTTTGSTVITTTSTCTDSASTYEYKSPYSVGSSLTLTVNVGSDTCTTGGAAGGSGSPGGGGGGGSSGASYTYVPPTTQPAAVVKAAPKATVSAPAAVAAISANITRAFAKGATSPQIKTLQQLLNSDPDTRIAATGVGSPGQETTLFGPATLKALQKFQVKYGIAKPGVEGYGVLGPKTRAKLNELGGKGIVPAAASVKPAASTAQTSAIQKQIDAALAQIKILQEQLKKAK